MTTATDFATLAPTEAPADTIYQAIGGRAAVTAAVDGLYGRLLACLACAAIIALSALAGLWFLPFLAGLGAGLVARYARLRLRVTLTAVVLVAAAGWGAALAWLALRDGLPEQPVARTIAALGGLGAHAAAGIAVTLFVAATQAAAGLWLGRALAPGHAR